MKQIKKRVLETCLNTTIGTAWVAGLLIAGSESTGMPWVNITGLVLFSGASMVMGKRLQAGKKSKKKPHSTRLFKRDPLLASRKKRGNRRLHTRYAMSA